jgi:hypothetical protein
MKKLIIIAAIAALACAACKKKTVETKEAVQKPVSSAQKVMSSAKK